MDTTRVAGVSVMEPRAADVSSSIGYADNAQSTLSIGALSIIVTAKDFDAIDGLEAIAAHALAVADWLRECRETREFTAGCSCGWRGSGDDLDEHHEVCPLPDPADLSGVTA